MKIEYITDVIERGHIKFVVSVGGVNKTAEQVTDYGNKEGLKAIQFGDVSVDSNFHISSIQNHPHLSSIVLSIEVAKVIVEHFGQSAFKGLK